MNTSDETYMKANHDQAVAAEAIVDKPGGLRGLDRTFHTSMFVATE
jgi:hypothetical protein